MCKVLIAIFLSAVLCNFVSAQALELTYRISVRPCEPAQSVRLNFSQPLVDLKKDQTIDGDLVCNSDLCRDMQIAIKSVRGARKVEIDAAELHQVNFLVDPQMGFSVEEVKTRIIDAIRQTLIRHKRVPKNVAVGQEGTENLVPCPEWKLEQPVPATTSITPLKVEQDVASKPRDVVVVDEGPIDPPPDLSRLLIKQNSSVKVNFTVDLRPGDGTKDKKTDRLRPLVIELQAFLASIKDQADQPLFILKGTPGVYGPGTAAAVNKYRALVGLPNGDWTEDVRTKANANAHVKRE